MQNKALIFRDFPSGPPIEGKDLALEDRPFDLDQEPPDGGITTKNYYVSFDPYQRGRLRRPEITSYAPAYKLGEPISNNTVAKILKSNNSNYKPGDIIRGELNTEEYSVVPQVFLEKGIRVLQNPYNLDLRLFLGALGMPGLTAYSSFYEIGKPKKGETIFISSASGAVGQIVGQLAKHEGLRVIGSVGSNEKLEFLTKELDFDGGFNYKDEKADIALKRLAPDGIDIYFENVGGEQLDAALRAMKNFGRIIACGMISQYNAKTADELYGVKSIIQVVSKRITMRGFIVSDPEFGPVYGKDHVLNVSKWISEGKFKTKEDITCGMDCAISGLLGIFDGKNFGKAVLQIDELKVSD